MQNFLAILFFSFSAVLLVNGQSPCTDDQFQKIMYCNALSMDTEWANLLTSGDKYIAEKQNLANECYKTKNCNVTLNFNEQWWSGFEQDIQHVVQVFLRVIDTASLNFVSCIAQNVIDNFHERVNKCMTTKFGITFPKVVGSAMPMPHDHLFLPERRLFKTYVSDRILSLVRTKGCPKQRYATELCVIEDSGVNNKCRDENLVKDSLCYKSLPVMCERISSCLEQVIPVVDGTISNLFTGNVQTLFQTCELEAQKLHNTKDPQYSRVAVHEAIEAASKLHLNRHTASSLNQLLFDIFRAFFDYNAAFC